MLSQSLLIPRTILRIGQFRMFATLMLIFPLFQAQVTAASTTNQFIRLTTYPTGGTPVRIVTADFNRDGKADVVAFNSNGVLSFLAGTGTGAFYPRTTIATLPSSSGDAFITAGDFNGDGNIDIALLPSPGTAVQVFAGHGDGTFAAPVTISDGLTSAGALASGDFNHDGRADIVVAGATSVSILLGSGSGIFATPQVTATGLNAAPGSLVMALGDVNRDSHLDVAVTDAAGNLQILLGSATGALRAQTVASWRSSFLYPPDVIAIADFDGDGKPDIAAAEGVDFGSYNFPTVCFFSGSGDGTFARSALPCLGVTLSGFSQMVVTHLNGKPGLTFPADPLMVFVNDGAGAFSQTNYSVGGPLALADFNGDGLEDIASGHSEGVQVVLNAGGGALRAPLSLTSMVGPAAGPFRFSVGMNTTDMNRDGHADLILDQFWDEHGSFIASVDVLLGGPRNMFTLSASPDVDFGELYSAAANPPAIGDFNGDGLLDVAYSANYPGYAYPPASFQQILFGDGKGNLVATGGEISFPSNYRAAAYLNADGAEDLVSVDGSGLAVLIGKGDGSFAPDVNYGVGDNPVFVLQRDLNGDGKRDLLVVNHDSDSISILLGKGDGTFKPQVAYAAGTMPNVAVTGDFNRDGKIDIAVGSNAGISVLLGNGNGTFQAQKLYPATGPITGIAQAPVRQDGIEALLGIDSASRRFVLLPGVGDGTFGTPVFYPTAQIPVAILSSDFDADGAPDIVLLNALQSEGARPPVGGGLSVYYNQGGDHVALMSTSTRPKATQLVTLTAHVTPSPFEPGTPSGKITFKDGTRYLGNVTMTAGTASLSTTLAAGMHSILALYSGDPNFNPNHSATITIAAAP